MTCSDSINLGSVLLNTAQNYLKALMSSLTLFIMKHYNIRDSHIECYVIYAMHMSDYRIIIF